MAERKFINREISWLHFNARVLQEAADQSVPLIERLRFLGIFSNNLDEFFKVRYATVKRINQAGKSGKKALGGFKAGKLLQEITEIVIERQAESLRILSEIREELKAQKISIITENEVEDYQIDFIKEYFLQKVSPALVTIMLNAVETIPHLKDSK
ncbi:MAG: polyphosphate kinase 1, partial [Psychroflexus sp.]|nr:polyphosphate kinase 1 [Psychroflexus sp.]MDN6311088.1 polyphosphate kinase 1 [Psychroflexus sp.]